MRNDSTVEVIFQASVELYDSGEFVEVRAFSDGDISLDGLQDGITNAESASELAIALAAAVHAVRSNA